MSASDPPTRLNTALEGRYRIERELGEGGMATVYLADDLKHERKVALKVLKPELAAVVGAERFLAEIKTTANLQHPHILPLFDSGEADSFLFYVMPYVEGETLRQRIDRDKQLPVDDAVGIASAVAKALQHAHDRGVIHRDIKPGNILLQDGQPVVSDFGIALAVGSAGGGRLTETGLSVGTPYYMAPEQASGDQAVGPGADVYALGAVLYEMLIGEPPYTGSTAQAVLAKVLTGEAPAPRDGRASIPAHVDAVIRRALERLPADRFSDAGELARGLADPSFRHGADDAYLAAGSGAELWRKLALSLGAVAIIAVATLGWMVWAPAPEPLVTRFPSPFLEGQAPPGPFELTPDGSALVYQGPAAGAGGTQIWMRRLDRIDATPIPGTDGVFPRSIALSPDGSRVAFIGLEGLETVSIDGSGFRRLIVGPVLGVSEWSDDGWIYYVSMDRDIRRVSVDGAVEEGVVPVDGLEIPVDYRPIAGSDMGVYQRTSATATTAPEIWSHDRATGETAHITIGLAPRVLDDGRLMFVTPEGDLRVAPMDPSTAQLMAAGEVLESDVEVRQNDDQYVVSTAHVATSRGGTLIYRAGPGGAEHHFAWLDRAGRATAIDPDFTFDPGGAANRGWRLSPRGDRVVFAAQEDGDSDIWVKPLPVGLATRLTRSELDERQPQWSPDGARVLYRVGSEIGALELHAIRADGTREGDVVWRGRGDMAMASWSPDGEWLIMRRGGTVDDATGGIGARDVLALHLGEDSVPRPVAASPDYAEVTPMVSRDGRWIAYSSNETGQYEVYVRPFPATSEGRWAVSTAGGLQPVWGHNGRELYFINRAREMVSVTFDVEGANFLAREQRVLFSMPEGFTVGTNANTYDVALDDERFLVALPRSLAQDVFQGVVIVLNGLRPLR